MPVEVRCAVGIVLYLHHVYSLYPFGGRAQPLKKAHYLQFVWYGHIESLQLRVVLQYLAQILYALYFKRNIFGVYPFVGKFLVEESG